jgi:hypothetical protein
VQDSPTRRLETSFNYAGHYLRQIWRQDDIALYERSRFPQHPAHELELVIIKVAPEKIMPNGARVPAHERYPSASEWGSIGWSFPVRQKDTVLALAEKLHGITENRAALVRAARHQLWSTTDACATTRRRRDASSERHLCKNRKKQGNSELQQTLPVERALVVY